jgi:hypothetical protein
LTPSRRRCTSELVSHPHRLLVVLDSSTMRALVGWCWR